MNTHSITDNCSLDNLDAPCFKGLTPEELALIKDSKTQVAFRKGENLTKQGAFASSVLFIVSGLVKQYVEGEGAKNINLRIIKGGEFVGLSVAFKRNTYNYSTAALTETAACLIEKDAIANLVKTNGPFAWQIINRYCEQDGDLYQTIGALAYKQMNGRFADALLYLSQDAFKDDDLFMRLSRKDIADFAGLSVESAVRLLKTYENDGLIRLDDKNIVILNQPALLEISKRG